VLVDIVVVERVEKAVRGRQRCPLLDKLPVGCNGLLKPLGELEVDVGGVDGVAGGPSSGR